MATAINIKGGIWKCKRWIYLDGNRQPFLSKRWKECLRNKTRRNKNAERKEQAKHDNQTK